MKDEQDRHIIINSATPAGETRRDFLQKVTKTVIGGGVLIGALAIPAKAMANARRAPTHVPIPTVVLSMHAGARASSTRAC